MAKHRTFECKINPVSTNRATIKDVNKPGKVLERASWKINKVNFPSKSSDDESDEEFRNQESFGTKARKDFHVYAHYAYATSAMDFNKVISSAGSNCFSHGTDSQGNFMNVYGTQSRGPQKHSTDL
jgi:hypothetical protein